MHTIIKEGLKTYCVCPSDYSEYFYGVEYKTIRNNKISSLLPPQIREKDNHSEIYYDISGKRSLQDCAGDQAFSYDQCRNILDELLRMMGELEEYLLEAENISYDPACIYMRGKKLFWLYGVWNDRSIQEELEDFLSFILSKIDYEDSRAVYFIYQIFWLVRQQGFSVDLIEELLKEPVDEGEENEEIKGDDYDEFFKENSSRLQSEESRKDGFGSSSETFTDVSGRGKRESRLMPILGPAFLILILIGSLAGASILLLYGWEKGFTDAGKLVLALCLLPAAGSGCLSFRILKNRAERRNGLGEDIPDVEESKERAFDEKRGKDLREEGFPFVQDGIDHMNPISSEGEGTMILSKLRRDCPVLKSMEDGSQIPVNELPFYIGSDPVLNQLVLIDKTISRQHAVLWQEKKNRYLIKDLGSTNGTWIKGVMVEPDRPGEVEDGAIICFAQKKYRFLINP